MGLFSLFVKNKDYENPYDYEDPYDCEDVPEGDAWEDHDPGFRPMAMGAPQRPLSVRFTKRAFTEIISETNVKVSTETGGIFLGYRTGNEWIVVEAIDPGPDSIFQYAYFEYDQRYVTHLANRISVMYERPLEILGLWHRHPGSFDQFSGTDDGTNETFASMHPCGAISALVNIDPDFRLTMRAVDGFRRYRIIPFTVMDDADSIVWAPYRNQDDLLREVRTRNDACLRGYDASASVTVGVLTMTAIEAQERIKRAISNDSTSVLVEEGSIPASDMTDDQIGEVFEILVQDSAYFKKNKGLDLSLRMDENGALELCVGDQSQKCPLGSFTYVGAGLILMSGDRAIPFREGLIKDLLTAEEQFDSVVA